MGKRRLGLGRAAQAKRQQQEGTSTAKAEKEEEEFVTVPLDKEVDPDDPQAQLVGLWTTWVGSDRENMLILNGVVNECDRILKAGDAAKPTAEVFAIFGLALAELAKFNTEEGVQEYFENALEKVESGLGRFPDAGVLKYAKASILVSRIPLEYISQMDEGSAKKDFPNISDLLDEATGLYSSVDPSKEDIGQPWIFEILEGFDDLVDIVRSFGKNRDEEEDEEEEEEESVALGSDHPLSAVVHKIETGAYDAFYRTEAEKYLQAVRKLPSPNKDLVQRVAHALGVWYMGQAETGEDAGQARQAAVLLGDAWDDEQPGSWVDLAEAQICLANLVEEAEQEQLYTKAEELLTKANNATHGKYAEVLESLRE